MNTEINSPSPEISSEKLETLISQKVAKQNIPLAILGGFISCLVGASLWAGITVYSGYQIGWMAVGVGFLVGVSVRYFGKGVSLKFGFIGGGFALLACLLGNLFSIIGFISVEEGLNFFQTMLAINYAVIPEIMISTFNPIDLLFYGFALYGGYQYSFTQLSDSEVQSVME